jgi:hypothetical protein
MRFPESRGVAEPGEPPRVAQRVRAAYREGVTDQKQRSKSEQSCSEMLRQLFETARQPARLRPR